MAELPKVRKSRVSLGQPGHAYYTLLVGDFLEPIPLVDGFLHDEVAVHGKAPNSSKAYAGWMSAFVKYHVHFHASFEQIADNFTGYLAWRRKLRRTTKGRGAQFGASAATINQELGVIARFYQYAIGEGKINAWVREKIFVAVPEDARRMQLGSPWRSAAGPKLKYKARTGGVGADEDRRRRAERPRAATDKEFVVALEVAKSARDRFAFGLMRHPGLRVGAVSTLKRNRIHVALGSCQAERDLGPHIHIAQAPDHPYGDGVKTYYDVERMVPIGAQMLELYWAWLEERKQIKEAKLSPWLVVTLPGSPKVPAGQAISADGLRQRLTELCNLAGVRELTPHMLRHAMGEHASDLNLPADVLQRLLAHGNIHSQAIYRNPSAEATVAAIEKLENLR